MKLTEEKLDRWFKQANLKRLHAALEYNDYKIRFKAVQLLGRIGSKESLPHLNKLIQDPFLLVLEESVKVIKSISSNHESIPKFKARIAELSDFNLNRAAKTNQNFTPIPEAEERKRLEQMSKDYGIMKIYQEGLREEKRQMLNWKTASLIFSLIALIACMLWFIYYSQ